MCKEGKKREYSDDSDCEDDSQGEKGKLVIEFKRKATPQCAVCRALATTPVKAKKASWSAWICAPLVDDVHLCIHS